MPQVDVYTDNNYKTKGTEAGSTGKFKGFEASWGCHHYDAEGLDPREPSSTPNSLTFHHS